MSQQTDVTALAMQTASTLVRAARLVERGMVYDLGLELNAKSPTDFDMPSFQMSYTHTPEGTGRFSAFQYAAEVITGAVHLGTHIDALVHVQAEDRIFGGHSASTARNDRGWLKHGMETVPPIIGRGLFLDIPRCKALDSLDDGYEISVEDISQALEAIGRSIEPGDVVIVRTGKIRQVGDLAAFLNAEPGVGREAALWMHAQGMSVLATDTPGTEPAPFKDEAHTTHRAMLVEKGVHLIENCDLERLSQDRVTDGLFIALPLKITGATGSWLRPVLVV